jgi:hypothetical protein
MKRLRCVGLATLMMAPAWGQAVAQGKPAALPNRSDALVGSLYEQVIARHPLGVPDGEDVKIFAPYLSKALLHRFDLNDACLADWYRQNPDPDLKPIVGMIESGVFSGPDDESEPQIFHIERTEPRKDGSSRVYVRLTWNSPPVDPLTWYVAAIVVPEDGRLVVNDVLFLKNRQGDVEYRLSKALSSGCKGGRWVGRPR